MSELKRTPLRDFHAAHGGRLVDFAGWEMPVQYKSILEEHKAVRRAAGLFDGGLQGLEFGRILAEGLGCEAFLRPVGAYCEILTILPSPSPKVPSATKTSPFAATATPPA